MHLKLKILIMVMFKRMFFMSPANLIMNTLISQWLTIIVHLSFTSWSRALY